MLGTACGLGVEGSGWVAAPGLVVTNAHVVAGEDDTTVTTEAGASLDATPVHYDPDNDLALLRIDAPIPALEIAPERRARHRRRASSATPRTAPTPSPPPGSATPARDQRGLLRPRADPAPRSPSCAAASAAATPAAPWSTPAAG